MTVKVLNGTVRRGDLVAYSVRKEWDMATRIGVVVGVSSWPAESGLLVRVVKSSDNREMTRMVWLLELDRVVKLKGLQ